MLARLNDKPIFPSYSHGVDNIPFATVRDYIGSLPKLQAGESDSNDLLHAAAVIQPINIKRLQHTPEGGDRRDWPDELWLNCHRKYDGHTDVYGIRIQLKTAQSLSEKRLVFKHSQKIFIFLVVMYLNQNKLGMQYLYCWHSELLNQY